MFKVNFYDISRASDVLVSVPDDGQDSDHDLEVGASAIWTRSKWAIKILKGDCVDRKG